VKTVTDDSLEQQAILAVGWLRKAGRLAAGKSVAAEELPPGTPQTPQEYVQAQYALAHETVNNLVSQVNGLSDKAAEALHTLQERRAGLALATGKKNAKEINREAQTLAMQVEAAQAMMEHAARLLRILHGQEEIPLPVMPLYKYAQALERFEGNVSDTPAVAAEQTQKLPFHKKVAQGFLRRTDRSDRIALSIALILCITVIAAALYYVFFNGAVELQITSMDNAALRVVCTNTTYDSILLNVPYTGGGLPVESVTQYGLLIELVGEDGKIHRPAATETLWKYKDTPAHLYGPIVIGPMFAAELSLDLKTYANDNTIKALRITLYRAPDKKVKVYETVLPEEFWTLPTQHNEKFPA